MSARSRSNVITSELGVRASPAAGRQTEGCTCEQEQRGENTLNRFWFVFAPFSHPSK